MMNDNLNDLKISAETLLQQLFVCLEKNDKQEDYVKMQEKIDLLLKNTEEIVRQNNEIITLNNKLLEALNKTSFHEIKTKKEFDKTKKEFTETPLYFEQVQKQENEVVDSGVKEIEKEKEEKQEKVLSIEEQVLQTQKEIENLQKQKEIEQQKQQEQAKEIEKQQKAEEKQKTSSVLEFLHQRVIKDNVSQSVKETPKEEIQQTSSIRNITEQIKKEAKLTSEKKPRSIAEQFEDKTNKDLLSAIGVSEKFMFINDLFSGDIKEYTAFINNLNSAENMEQSFAYMEGIQKQKKWAKGSLAYTTLEGIVTKRFE